MFKTSDQDYLRTFFAVDEQYTFFISDDIDHDEECRHRFERKYNNNNCVRREEVTKEF